MKRIVCSIGLAAAIAAVIAFPAGARVNVAGVYPNAGPPDGWYLKLQAEQAYEQYLLTHGPSVSPDDRPGIRSIGTVSAPTPVSDSGIDWGKVSTGLGSGVLVILLAAGMFVVLRRPRRTVHA
jgi:hypothetical protein